jgi:hypothetical protein
MKGRNPMRKVILFGVILMPIVIVLGCQGSEPPKSETARALTPADSALEHLLRFDPGNRYHTVENAPACVSKEQFEEMQSYVASRDEGALQQLMRSGDCALVKAVPTWRCAFEACAHPW